MSTPWGTLARQYRERADLGRNELARAVGVDPSYISRWEAGQRGAPHRAIVERVAQVLGLPPLEWLRFVSAAGYIPYQSPGWQAVPVTHPVAQTVVATLVALDPAARAALAVELYTVLAAVEAA